MKKILFILLISGILYFAWISLSGRFQPVRNRDSAGQSIVVIGDSIAHGTGVGRDGSFVSLLSREFGVDIINAGVPGDTSGAALKRFSRDVLERHPRVVMIELGGNDMLQRLDKSQTLENIRTMVEKAQDAGAAVVIMGIDSPFGLGGYGKELKEMAREHEAIYIANIMKGIITNPSLRADNVHPNSQGHALIADRVAKQLRRSLPNIFK